MVAVMLCDRITANVPWRDGRPVRISVNLDGGAERVVKTLPQSAEKRSVVRQNDYLGHSLPQSPQLLDRRDRTMFIETRNRVINDNYLVFKCGVAVDRCKEERQC